MGSVAGGGGKRPRTSALVASDEAPIVPPRLAYRIDETMTMLGVSRSTIERAIADGRLRSSKKLGVRLIEAESLKALFDDGEASKG